MILVSGIPTISTTSTRCNYTTLAHGMRKRNIQEWSRFMMPKMPLASTLHIEVFSELGGMEFFCMIRFLLEAWEYVILISFCHHALSGFEGTPRFLLEVK